MSNFYSPVARYTMGIPFSRCVAITNTFSEYVHFKIITVFGLKCSCMLVMCSIWGTLRSWIRNFEQYLISEFMKKYFVEEMIVLSQGMAQWNVFLVTRLLQRTSKFSKNKVIKTRNLSTSSLFVWHNWTSCMFLLNLTWQGDVSDTTKEKWCCMRSIM